MYKTKKNPAIEILGDPSATEDEWIKACELVKPDQFEQRRSDVGDWFGAVIDSGTTSVLTCFFLSTLLTATSNSFPSPYCINTHLMATAQFLFAIPFVFGFIYGLWMEKFKGRWGWITSYTLLWLASWTIIGMSNPVSTNTWLPCSAMFIFAAIPGLYLGKSFFRTLKSTISPFKIIGIGQLAMLGLPLIMIFQGFQMFITSLAPWAGILYMIGLITAHTNRGHSAATRAAFATITLMPILLMAICGAIVGLILLSNSSGIYCLFQQMIAVGFTLTLTGAGLATGHFLFKYIDFQRDKPNLKSDDSHLLEQQQDESLAEQAVRVSGTA